MAQSNGTARGDTADLLLITDAIASMSRYLSALSSSLPGIIHMSIVTGAFERIGVLAYHDYCDRDLLEWSGWCDTSRPYESSDQEGHQRDKRVSQSELVEFAAGLRAAGGGDFPEATKTALAMAHDVMREDATTVTTLYTKAPAAFGVRV